MPHHKTPGYKQQQTVSKSEQIDQKDMHRGKVKGRMCLLKRFLFCYGETKQVYCIPLAGLWDLCKASGHGTLPLWDDHVRSHCRQMAEAFSTHERFPPRMFISSKRGFIVEHESTRDSMGRSPSISEENWLFPHVKITARTLLQNHPKSYLIRVEHLVTLQILSHWPCTAVLSTACSSDNPVTWALL